ncbi:MAG: prolyl hydroxylase family protein [Vulcanococcus sp.]
MIPLENLVQVVPSLAGEELTRCLEHVQSLPFAGSSLTSDGGAATTRPQQARTSSSCLLEEAHPVTQLLHERLNRSVAIYAERLKAQHPAFDGHPLPGAHGVHSWREPLQVLRYHPGERYVFHHDCDFDRNREAYHRVLTAILYLNNDFEGGETAFSGGRIKPEPGQALVFPSNWCFPHAGCRVISGIKYAVVTWYHALPPQGA